MKVVKDMVDCAEILAKTRYIRQIKKNILSVKENKSRLIFVNNNEDELKRVKIDKGLLPEIDNSTQRCDFMIQHGNINYYVELKGTHYEEAFAQIARSIEMFNECFGCKECQPIIVVPLYHLMANYQTIMEDSGLNKHIADRRCKQPIIEESPYCLPLS